MQPIDMPTSPFESSVLARVLSDLATRGRRVTVIPRGALYEPTDAARDVFVILDGQIRTQQVGTGTSRRLVEILGPGDWCGTGALTGSEAYGERAEAALDSTAAAIPVELLVAELKNQPDAAIELIRQMAQKLASFREEAAGLVFDDCKSRLVRTLQRLSDSPAASRTGDAVTLRITHQQLAQAVGVARETVSLALSQLRRRNLLRTGRNQLMFNPDELVVAEAE